MFEKAIAAVMGGMSKSKAARTFGVPRTSICSRLVAIQRNK